MRVLSIGLVRASDDSCNNAGNCRHDLPVRCRSPKWRTLQVFDEWKGYRGAGEWTRTTDLLITNLSRLSELLDFRVILIVRVAECDKSRHRDATYTQPSTAQWLKIGGIVVASQGSWTVV